MEEEEVCSLIPSRPASIQTGELAGFNGQLVSEQVREQEQVSWLASGC